MKKPSESFLPSFFGFIPSFFPGINERRGTILVLSSQ